MSRANRRRARERRRRFRRIVLLVCALAMLVSLAYIVHYERTRREIVRENEEFSALYEAPQITPAMTDAATVPARYTATTAAEQATVPAEYTATVAAEQATIPAEYTTTIAAGGEPSDATVRAATYIPSAVPSVYAPVPDNSPTDTPEPLPTATPVPVQATPSEIAVTPSPSPIPTPTPTPTPIPSPSPTSSPAPSFPVAIDATLEPGNAASIEGVGFVPGAMVGPSPSPLATADADTVVVALETPPPVQESFRELIEANPETVGFLTIEDVLELPVVQRPNDNDYYLSHSFDQGESTGGTLFLDGSNLLIPEDDCLVIYGHNMHNGTMFQPLVGYEALDFLYAHPLVRFDTLYENRLWVPFAALTVTADPDSERYLDIRQFSYDAQGFDLFTHSLRALSIWDSPVEVEYGDALLLLVTCEYTHDNGRFVLALRAAREYESEYQLRSQVQGSH